MLTTNPFDDDKLKEECGIFGIWGAEGAASFVRRHIRRTRWRIEKMAPPPKERQKSRRQAPTNAADSRTTLDADASPHDPFTA